MIDRFLQRECRMFGCEAWNLFLEINVVPPLVLERGCIDDGLQFGDRSTKRLGPDQPFEIEHAIARQVATASGNQRLPCWCSRRVEWIKAEIEDVPHAVLMSRSIGVGKTGESICPHRLCDPRCVGIDQAMNIDRGWKTFVDE